MTLIRKCRSCRRIPHLYFPGQVFVGGAKQADVHGNFLLRANRAYRFFLDHPQQFDLGLQRQVGYLIQEQGAAIGAPETRPCLSRGRRR